MTVEELIQHLRNLPADTRVVVQGYEDGYDDISSIRSVCIKPAPNAEWYYGRYDDSPEEGESALLLFGRGRSDDSGVKDGE